MIQATDFPNYIQASLMLLEGIIPYGRVEFFAAPWISILFIPFTHPYGLILWQFLSLLAVGLAALLSFPRHWFIVLALFAPPTLYSIAVAQVSGIVGLACVILLIETVGKKRAWVLIACLFVATAKVSIAAVPVLTALYFLIRGRQVKTLIWILVFFGLLMGLCEFLIPDVMTSWVRAVFSGDYRKPQGLVYIYLENGYRFPFHFGQREYSSMPLMVSIPLLLLWVGGMKSGLTKTNTALALSIGFVFLPYWRLYDLVMLAYPIGHIISLFLASWKESYHGSTRKTPSAIPAQAGSWMEKAKGG